MLEANDLDLTLTTRNFPDNFDWDHGNIAKILKVSGKKGKKMSNKHRVTRLLTEAQKQHRVRISSF